MSLSTSYRTHTCGEISEDVLYQFQSSYESGESANSIGNRLGFHHETVTKNLKKLNVKIRTKSESSKLAFNQGLLKPPINTHFIPESSKILNKEKSYILGVLCGDVYMHCTKRQSYQVGLNVTDKDFSDFFFVCMKKVYQLEPNRSLIPKKKKNWKPQHMVRICSKEIFNDLKIYDKSEFKTFTWKLPKEIISSERNIKAEFLSGFFDSEGNVDIDNNRIRANSSNKLGLIQIQKLLSNIDIISTIIKRTGRENRGDNFILSVQDRKSIEIFYEFIGFKIKRKMDDLKILINSYSNYYKTPKLDVEKLINRMIQFRSKGFSYPKIAKELKVSSATVWNRLKKIKENKNV